MTKPTTAAYVFFTDTATASTRFILNDTTQGVLDSVSYTLSGDTGSDLTSYTNSISIRRGRSSQVFDRIDAGVCRIQLNNEARTFDPLHAAGGFYGALRPGKRVVVSSAGVVLFDGKTSDWDLSYETSGRSVAMLTAEDALATLGRSAFSQFTATGAQTAGPRLSAVLVRGEVDWPAGATDLDLGISILGADTINAGTNTLNYCQLVAQSDLGAFFASRQNVLTFRDRHSNLFATPVVAFADDGSGIPFQEATISFGSETFYQRISVTRTGGTEQVATSAYATSDGVRTFSLSGLLMSSDSQASDMAEYLAQTYALGEARIAGLRVTVDSSLMTATQMGNLLALELNDLVTVTWTPNGVGSAIDQTVVVQGIEHEIYPDRHDMTLTFGKYDGRTPFVLDDTTNGALDGVAVLSF